MGMGTCRAKGMPRWVSSRQRDSSLDRFEETRTEGAMDLDRSADRLAGERVQLGAWFSDGAHPKLIG